MTYMDVLGTITMVAVTTTSLGILPTINAAVAQFAIPKEFLSVAMGAIFFFQMISIAISPAIQGFGQNSAPTCMVV